MQGSYQPHRQRFLSCRTRHPAPCDRTSRSCSACAPPLRLQDRRTRTHRDHAGPARQRHRDCPRPADYSAKQARRRAAVRPPTLVVRPHRPRATVISSSRDPANLDLKPCVHCSPRQPQDPAARRSSVDSPDCRSTICGNQSPCLALPSSSCPTLAWRLHLLLDQRHRQVDC